MLTTVQKTEKMFLGLLSVALFVLMWNVYSNEPVVSTEVASAESEDDTSEPEDDSKSEEDDEEDDNKSEPDDEDEISEPSVETEVSQKSTTTSVTTKKSVTTPVVQEDSEPSVKEMDEVSTTSTKEDSEDTDENSEAGKMVPLPQSLPTTTIVKENGKLFMMIPVEIESEVTMDSEGKVLQVRKSFANWLKEFFSL